MEEPINATYYIGLAIPAFFFFMIIELILEKVKKKNYYRFADSITNISAGIGSQIMNIFAKSLLVVLFTYIYDHFALYHIPENWYTGILLFLLFDFAFYWAHRLGHRVNFLWAAHVVHHQSEEFNLSVALRQPWLSDILTFFIFIPLPLMGFSPQFIVLIGAIDILYQFIIHTKYVGKLHPVIEFIFNTPSHHRVHHAVNKQYIDKNYAGVLIIWDRLLNTFEEEKEEPLYGITVPFKSWNPVWANIHYWIDLFKLSEKSKRIIDKILVFFTPPGWQPKELGGYQPPKLITKENYNKYESSTEGPIKKYIIVQYVILLVIAGVFLNFYKHFSLLERILPSTLILFNTVVLGALAENKFWGKYLEYIRLLLTAIAGTYYCLAYTFAYHYLLVGIIIFFLILFISWYWYMARKSALQLSYTSTEHKKKY